MNPDANPGRTPPPAALATDAMTRAVDALMERLEHELRGAWRAGYDYVHVYDDTPPELGRGDLDETFAVTQYVYPSNREKPPSPPGVVYRYTYDLRNADDERVRDAVVRSNRGDPLLAAGFEPATWHMHTDRGP